MAPYYRIHHQATSRLSRTFTKQIGAKNKPARFVSSRRQESSKLVRFGAHGCKMVDVLEETYFTNLCLDDDEKHFHSIIGHIEDILMDQQFLDMHSAFMEKHWSEFEDTEENKLSYTGIFNEYLDTIEKYLEQELKNRLPNFAMSDFEAELKMRQKDLEGEIFEILATFSDFCAFKAMFLDYKNMKEGKTIDFSSDLCVSKCKTNIEHAENIAEDEA